MSRSQVRTTKLPLVNLVRMKGIPIFQQLHLEERLLRTSSDNWCIVNDGTNHRNIVMGISGKPAELLEVSSVMRDKVPVIRRFTGGDVQPYPKPIMNWSSLIFNKVFQGIGDFSLRENDYVFGNRKFGGNAQSIMKTRWIHHTSLLWDYQISNMAYLKLPKRAPEYRKARCHSDFICRLKDYLDRSKFIERTIDALDSHFSVESMELEEIESSSNVEFKPSSRILETRELEEARVDFQHEKISASV